MPVIQNSLGEMVDLATGKVMGRAEGTVTEVPTSPEALRRVGAPEVEESGKDRVKSIINQASWVINSSLFSFPDASVRAIGKGLGLNEDEVFQFTRYFNRGEQAPKNAAERWTIASAECAARIATARTAM